MIFRDWLDSLRRRRAAAPSRRKQHQSIHQAEVLEARRMLTTGTISLSATSGKLTIQGTANDDTSSVTMLNGTTVRATIQTGAGSLTQDFAAADVTSILFRGEAGDDTFTNSTAFDVRAFGDDGDDFLTGGSGDDELFGRSDNDTIVGGDGDDLLRGDDSNSGTQGNDSVDGGAG
ncbi:MAG: hypothetical protein CMJ78_18885, partial [Planctomycetaceae bacterium]|nr:hypothetical protein [Planctomycetaceae bacterium]